MIELTQRERQPFSKLGYSQYRLIDEACAIVSGVNTHDDMLKASVKAVSKDATKLGIKVGMTGAEAMELLR